jgi:hypothetical protein
VDGRLSAIWRITSEKDAALLRIEAYARLPGRDAIAAEGERLLAFVVEEASAATSSSPCRLS